jgi:hypothetical protein
MSLSRAAELSCDIYKQKSRILGNYKHKGIKVIEKNRHPIVLTLREDKDLYVTFRGCKDMNEFLKCINTTLVRPDSSYDIKINKVFWETYMEVKGELENVFASHDMTDVSNIVFTGHSKGGAIAQIASSLLENKYTIGKRKHCITFGAPYVGDKGFQERIEQTIHEHKRVVAQGDIIPLAKLHRELVHNGNTLLLETTIQSPLNCVNHHSCQNYIEIAKKIEQQ